MRGDDTRQEGLFSYLSPEKRVPADHPLRAIRRMVDEALGALGDLFESLYARTGRPSIAPEKLLRASLLQIFYSVRSERQLMEQLSYNLLFRWFVGLSMDEEVWDHSVFSKNRERLLEGEVTRRFFEAVLGQAEEAGLVSEEHFSVDGTLIEAWASFKSFRPKGEKPEDRPPPDDPGNPTVDFRGEKRSNQTHQSTSDGEARLYKKGKGKEARLCYLGHALMENRSGLAIDGRLTQAGGTAECEAALEMVGEMEGRHRITVGGDKLFDTEDFVAGLRELGATPHVAQNDTNRSSNIDGRVTRHPGYAVSQRIRKRVEEIFGWAKTVGGMAKVKLRGTARVGFRWLLSLAGYNLLRMGRLLPPTPA